MKRRSPWSVSTGSTAPSRNPRKPKLRQMNWELILPLRGARFGRAWLRRASRVRAADRQAIHPQCRLADTDRHALAVFPTGGDPITEAQVIAYHRDFGQRIRSVADQSCAFDRGSDLAVLDQIRFGSRKYELARGDVDLSAAEIDGIDPALDRGHDFRRVMAADQHVGIGHPRHRGMRKTLSSAVPGWGGAEEARIHAVLHIAFENPVLDEDSIIRRRTLIVYGQRATPVGHCPVVDDRHTLARDALPDHSGESRRLLAVEVAFEPVADRLVQHDPRPPRPQDDGHLARRRRHRAEVDERLAQGFIDLSLPLLWIEIEIVADAAPRAGGAGLHAVTVADDDRHAEPQQRADIRYPPAIGSNDLHRLPDAAERSHDLPHARVAAARISVNFRKEPRLCPEIDEAKRVLLGVEAPVCPGRGRREDPGMTARHRSDSIGRAADRRF